MKNFATVRRINNNVNGNPRFAVNFFTQETSESDLLQVMPTIDYKWSDTERAFIIPSYYIQETIRTTWKVAPSAQVIII